MADSVDYPLQDKKCTQCEKVKPLSDFPRDGRRKDGRATKCRMCEEEIRRRYYERYPEAERRDRLRQSIVVNNWYQKNRSRLLRRFRQQHLLRKYGITEASYKKKLKSQKGRCAICDRKNPGRNNKHFLVDHDHITGRVRGLLCHRCNGGLASFGDEPIRLRKAAKYLEKRTT